jgi:hypothetical protein
MLGAQGFWAGRDLYRATLAVTRDVGFSGIIRRTAPISHLLRHTRGCGWSILTQILTGPLSIALYNTQGDVDGLFQPGSSWVQLHGQHSEFLIMSNRKPEDPSLSLIFKMFFSTFDVKLIRDQFWCTRCAFRLLKSLQWCSGRKSWKSNIKNVKTERAVGWKPNRVPWNWAKSVEG